MSDARDRMLMTAKRRYKTFQTRFGEFTIQSLSEGEHRGIQSTLLKNGEVDVERQTMVNSHYIQACLVETNGDGEYSQVWLKEEIPLIAKCDVALTRRLMVEIDKHCGFSDENQQLEELEKNSEPTGGDSSSTD